jgi:hypothetical protein
MKIKYPVLSALGLLILYLLFWPSEKDRLNAQMAELCKVDGGLKVYERAKVSAEGYSNGGVLKETDYRKINEEESIYRLANVYEVHVRNTKIKKGNPFKGEGILQRTYGRFVRLSDGKLIAESIHYSRVGGDRWFVGMPSAENCPVSSGLERDKIFIRID